MMLTVVATGLVALIWFQLTSADWKKAKRLTAEQALYTAGCGVIIWALWA